ncbi:unnamed protein product, partial [Polarella glacialis]
DSPQRSEAFRLVFRIVPAVCGVLCLACIGFCVGLLADQQFQQSQIDRLRADVRRLVEDSSSNAGTTARRAQSLTRDATMSGMISLATAGVTAN